MERVNGSTQYDDLPEGFHYGRIIGFRGSWSSGLGYLVMEDEHGKEMAVPCDNGATVRALDGCFGDVIGDAHCVNDAAIKGKEIIWSYDEFGMILGGFTPVECWDQEAVEAWVAEQEGGEA